MVETAPLLKFTSHTDGKNAKVEIYSDRIEWTRESGVAAAAGRWTAASLTAGLSLLKTGVSGHKDTNVLPIRLIQGITTRRAGFRYTAVVVSTAADSIEFHVSANEAEQAKSTITRLMIGELPTPVATTQPLPPPPASPQGDPAEQLRKLADLHQSGLLTDEEFALKRAALIERL